jgi:hypothetical protein
MGNDFIPPESSNKSNNKTGYLSSIASAVSTAVMGDAESSPKYAGHPGASGNFGPPSSMYSGASGAGGYGQSGTGGYGQSGSGGGGYGQSSSGGFGNPNFQDARAEKSWMQRAGELASSAAGAAGFGKSETSEPLHSSAGGFAPRKSGTFDRAAFSNPDGGASGGFNRAAFSNPDGYNYATNRGPNAIHANSPGYAPQAYGASGGYPGSAGPGATTAPTSIVPDMPPNIPGFGRAGGGMVNGNYEKSIIDSLCEPAGLRPVPPEDKLQDFLSTASTLSEDIVGNCLLDVLNDESWQARTKALIVLAKLVRQPDCTGHHHWWQQHVDVVESLQSDTKANVRTQAGKTLRAIDPSAPVAPVAASAPAATRRSLPGRAGSFMQPDNVSEMGTTITEDGSQAISDAGDLEPTQQQTAEPSLLLGADQPPPPAPVPQEANLLGFDDLEDMPTTTPAGGIPSTVQMSPQVPVSPLANEYTGGESTPQYSVADTDELFAGMSVGDTTPAHPPAVLSPTSSSVALLQGQESSSAPTPQPNTSMTAAAPSSAFDFLNAGTDSAAAPAPEVDLFGSLTIADPTASAPTHAAASPAQPSSAIATGSTKSYFDDFAGLVDTPSAPLSGSLPAQSPVAPYQQPSPYAPAHQPSPYGPGMTAEQQLLAMQAPMHGAPHSGAPHPGLHLTRPVPPPAAGYAPYHYPPRGMPGGPLPPGARTVMPGHMAGGMPPGAMGMPPGAMGVAPRPMGVPMAGSMQPAIQLRQGTSVIAPGMLSHTAERKSIPDAAGAGTPTPLLVILFVVLMVCLCCSSLAM